MISAGEAKPGALCPLWGSPTQERHRHTGKSNKGPQRGSHEEKLRDVTFQPGEVKAQEGYHQCVQTSEGKMLTRTEPGSSQ